MTNALTAVTFNHPMFGQLRILPLDGEAWFVAADIARVLEYRDSEKMTRNIKNEYRGTQIVGTPGGDQKMAVINASGLFQAVLACRKVQAEPFQKWVLGEVLPSIARTGSYSDHNNKMGSTLSDATGGAVDIEQAPDTGAVLVSQQLLKALEEELHASRAERRLLVRTFSQSVGRMVRVLGVQQGNKAALDPDRPFCDEESVRAEFLFRSGLSGREVARRMNRSYAATAKYMAGHVDLLQNAIQASLI